MDALHIDLRIVFDRLRRLGVKFSISTIRVLALWLIEESDTCIYASKLIDQQSGKEMSDKIDVRWI